MRNTIDFSSWQGIFSTLLGLIVVSLVAVGIRLLVMQSIQQRRERQNRQINERLKTLIAAYKTLGGSFTGDLAVDPSHLRQVNALRDKAEAAVAALDRAEAAAGLTVPAATEAAVDVPSSTGSGSERRRRIRDAVEAALSDVILLGTQEQVRMASQAANAMVAGRPIETSDLVASLRTFIREVLDLESIPADVVIPRQGPLRVAAGGGRSGAGGQGGARAGGGGAGRGGGGSGMAGGGMALGAGMAALPDDVHRADPRP